MNLTLEDLVETKNGNRFVIPWKWLTASARQTLQVIFAVYFDEEQDFSRGFAVHHLGLVSVSDAKAIRYLDPRKVNFLVEEIQKIVKNPKYLSLPTLDDELVIESSSAVDVFEIYDDMIRKASNLQDFTNAILERLTAEFEISDRNLQIVLERSEWICDNPSTLDAIGKEYGITRERVRQITKKYENPVLRIKGQIRFIDSVVAILENAGSLEDFMQTLIGAELSTDNYISMQRLNALFAIFGESSEAAKYFELLEMLESEERRLNGIAGGLSKFRSKLGFIDLSYAQKSLGIELDQLKNAILQKYPRTLFVEKLALARTNRWTTIFESSIGKQLLFNQNLESSELLVGIKRIASQRQDSLSFNDEIYIELIGLLCGNPINAEKFLSGMDEDFELSESDSWLIREFQNSHDGMLHRIEIAKRGIETGFNLGSLTAYLGSSPLIRPLSNGVFTLVGNSFLPDEVLTHAELALAQDPAVGMSLEYEGSNIYLNLTPNLGLHSSGVVLPNREIKDLFSGYVFALDCTCGACKSEQLIRLSKDGFWQGFNGLLSHALTVHKIGLGATLRIYFDFELQKATLQA